jgi:MFS family permease
MFLSAIGLALVVGALAGGGLPRLADLRLRWLWLLGLALALRLGAYLAGGWNVDTSLPLGGAFIAAYFLIFAWLWGNWRVPGLQVAAVGIGLNTIAVLLNAGQMPVWTGALAASGLTPNDLGTDPFHFLMSATSVADFVQRGGIFGDVVPFPVPIIRDVVSIGDVLLALGIFWAIVSSMNRPNAPVRSTVALPAGGIRPTAGGEFEAGVAFAGAFATPQAAAASGPAVAFPARPVRAPADGATARAPAAGAMALPGEAARPARAESPYLRLARNGNFALLWVGQLVSVMGDRINQIALVTLVAINGTALEVGITFAMTAIPNVFLGPVAGALVDRWDRRITMIVCDVVRAVLVLLVPLAFDVNIGLVYAIAFAVATVSLLFRPAKVAIVPVIVDDADLVAANSAVTLTETVADIIGYPLAGLLAAALSSVIAVAFVIDGATYLVSGILLWTMAMSATGQVNEPMSIRALWREMVDGWQFLNRQAELFSNTIVSAFSQIAVGAEIACSGLYALTVLDRSRFDYPFNYSLLMAAIGLGSVVGGVVIGAFADRFPKGPMSIAGFLTFGLLLTLTAFIRDPVMAIVLFFGVGAANMVFLIPNITLFQQRTPQRLMGRVVSSRQALVFAVMAVSMGASGWLAGVLGPVDGPAWVMAGGGAISALAAFAAIFVPSMRNAR